MYRVDQDKGMSYTANGPHILVLYNIETKEIIDIELERYIELPEQIRGRLRGVVKLQMQWNIRFIHHNCTWRRRLFWV